MAVDRFGQFHRKFVRKEDFKRAQRGRRRRNSTPPEEEEYEDFWRNVCEYLKNIFHPVNRTDKIRLVMFLLNWSLVLLLVLFSLSSQILIAFLTVSSLIILFGFASHFFLVDYLPPYIDRYFAISLLVGSLLLVVVVYLLFQIFIFVSESSVHNVIMLG